MLETSLKSLSAIILLLLFAQVAHTDGGSIPFKSGAKIFEPNQKAVIGWNGDEEILLLSTDLRSSIDTSVLQVIPFPSEPKVKRGDLCIFKLLNASIKKELERTRRNMQHLGMLSGTVVPIAGNPGEITFHETIGSHDVTVVSLKRPKGFVEYVQNHLKSQTIHDIDIPEAMKQIIPIT